MSMTYAGQHRSVHNIGMEYDAGVLHVSGLHEHTKGGAWEGEMELNFH